METASTAALLVVDVQYDFLPGGSLAVPDGDQVLPVIRDLLKGKWSFVVASQDYHPAGHVSFASMHSKNVFTQIDVPYPYAKDGEPSMIPQMLWPDHCVQGTHGAEIDESVLDALQPWLDAGRGLIIQKGMDPSVDAYSAFASTPGIPAASARLTAELRARGVSSLFVVGLAMDYCVRASALDARHAGFETFLVREGMRAVGGAEASERVEAECAGSGIEVLGVGEERVKMWV